MKEHDRVKKLYAKNDSKIRQLTTEILNFKKQRRSAITISITISIIISIIITIAIIIIITTITITLSP
jgi:hypothetical protein